MAHHIQTVGTKTGAASFAYNKKGGKAWHGLGVAGQDDWSLERWLTESGSDYGVDLRKTFFEAADGSMKPTGKMSLVRDFDERYYGNCSEDWNPVQNAEALEVFRDVCDAGDMTIDTVGNLKHGQIFFAMATVKGGEFSILKGKDVIKSNMLFCNPHIVGRAWNAGQTATRVVCANTLRAAQQQGLSCEIRGAHTKKFDVESIRSALGMSAQAMATFKEQAEHLVAKKAKGADVVEYFKAVFDLKEPAGETPGFKAARAKTEAQVDKLKLLLNTQPGAELGAGSWWQAFNACTYHIDHETGKTPDSRLTSAWFGTNANRKVKALNLALAA